MFEVNVKRDTEGDQVRFGAFMSKSNVRAYPVYANIHV